jgi:hypothetical protein
MEIAAMEEVAKPPLPGLQLASALLLEGEPMQAIAMARWSAVRAGSTSVEALPDPLPKPPGRAPGEPIIIKRPPRPAEAPEIDRPIDDEDDPEIKKPPEIIPEKPPPPAPWDRANRVAGGLRVYPVRPG